MACGSRARLVNQAACVWGMMDKATDFAWFIETGLFGPSTQVMPYRPEILQAIQESGAFGGS